MRVRRTVKEKDVIKILVFGCDRKLIKSAMDSGFRSMWRYYLTLIVWRGINL